MKLILKLPMLTTILKVLGLSVFLSFAIKYVGPLLPAAATPINAWVAVLVPPSVMAIALTWRWQISSVNPSLGKSLEK